MTETPETTEEAPKRARTPKQADVPTVARVVHYQPYEDAAPLAAVITVVGREDDGQTVGLAVFKEHLTMFRPAVPFADTPTPGHWNWPPRA